MARNSGNLVLNQKDNEKTTSGRSHRSIFNFNFTHQYITTTFRLVAVDPNFFNSRPEYAGLHHQQ